MTSKPHRFHDRKLEEMARIAADLRATNMANGGPYLSVQSYLGMNKEAIRGTAPSWTNGSAVWIPVNPNPQLTPTLTWQTDDSLRGSPVDVYDDILLTNYSKYDFKGYVFADTVVPLLLGTLGGPDTVSGTVAPYSHYIPLLNDPESGSQPPSFTVADVDLIEESGYTDNAKQMTDGQMMSFALDFTATGALNYTASLLGQSFTEIVKPTASWSTEALIPAYNGVITFGGTQSFVVTKGTLMIDRKTAPLFTVGSINSQYGGANPFRLFAGAITVTGTFEFLALADDQTMLQGLTYDKQVVTTQFTDQFLGHSIYFQFDKVQFKNPKVMRDQPYVRVTTDFSAEANPTDAVTGFSPMFARAINGISTAY